MQAWAIILLLIGFILVGLAVSYFVVRFYFPTFHAFIWTRNNEEKQLLTKKCRPTTNETCEEGVSDEKSKMAPQTTTDRCHTMDDTVIGHASGRSSPGSTGSEYEPGYNLPRAASTDSLASDSSVLELQPDLSKIGQIEIGLDYDPDTSELVVSVIQARDLSSGDVDYYVNIYVYPDAANMRSQTKVQKRVPNPLFKERFLYSIEPHELPVKAVQFQLFCIDKYARHKHSGEAEVRLSDLDLIRPHRLWLNLRDMDERPSEFGELMFSMSYLPTAERLTVVVVKAKTLKWSRPQKTSGDVFVKVHLIQNGKRIAKKKTSVKRGETHPTFNEAMIFSLPQTSLHNVQLRLTVAEVVDNERIVSIGHVIVGANCGGTELTHWQQMISSLRKPIAMWHYLRKQEKKKTPSRPVESS